MEKLCKILLVSTMLLVDGCFSEESEKKEPASNNMEKTALKITVQNKVSKGELFNGSVNVEGKVETPADFLEKTKDLGVEMEDDQYGRTTMAMKGVETKDSNRRPWWLYESESNEFCKAIGSCDVVSSLKIEDGDDFIFMYTTFYQPAIALSQKP